jgi:hypothetical protein
MPFSSTANSISAGLRVILSCHISSLDLVITTGRDAGYAGGNWQAGGRRLVAGDHRRGLVGDGSSGSTGNNNGQGENADSGFHDLVTPF